MTLATRTPHTPSFDAPRRADGGDSATVPAIGICVLTFHRVVDVRQKDHDITRDQFHSCLQSITNSGHPVTTELDLTRVKPGSLVLTFDDTTGDHLAVAEELARRSIPAIFFASAGEIGTRGHLSGDELVELNRLGHVVGSHAFDHEPLDALSRAELSHEVRASRARLEAVVGCPVTYFAPPGGIAHPELAAELCAGGYEASRSMRWGIHMRGAERWSIPCVPVTDVTIARGWVEHAVRRLRLPPAMQLAWVVKRTLPARSRPTLRRRLKRTAPRGR